MHRKKFLKLSSIAFGGLGLASTSPCNGMGEEPQDQPTIQSEPKIIKADQGKRINVIGDNQLVKLTGKDTNNQFTLIEQDNAPGIGIPPHVHENEDEIFKVLEGSAEIIIGEESAILNAGDLVFCPRGIPHSWKVIGTENAKVSLSIFPSGLENMFEELANLPKGKPDMQHVAEICGKYKVRFI